MTASLRQARPRLLLVLGTALLAFAAVPGTHAAVSQVLYGSITQNGQISLSFADGSAVGSPTPPGPIIPPGTYSVSVIDSADHYNFHLSGPGVDLTTGADAMEGMTWSVTFQPSSSYTYQDDQHSDQVFGIFRTSATPASTPSTGGTSTGGLSSGKSSGGSTSTDVVGSAVAPFRGKLTGALSEAGTASLTVAGKSISTLRSGRYTVTVTDGSKTDGFALRKLHKAPTGVTGVAFVGKHQLTVALTPGQWFYYGTRGGKKTPFVVTA